MKRVLVREIPEVGTVFQPDTEEAHHLLRVRRIQSGETVEILDGRGGLSRGRVALADKRILEIEVVEPLPDPRESTLRLELAVAVPVQISTFDALLPALVQLGIDRINLVATDYSGRLKKDPIRYFERLRIIALQALKQCGRTRCPDIEFAGDLGALCDRFSADNEANIVFHPGPRDALPEVSLSSLGLLVGPEGGFSDDEVALARSNRFRRCGLGPRILRTETAVVGACFWAQARFGDLMA